MKFLILCSAAQAITGLSVIDYALILVSAVLFVRWLIKTDFGTRALDNAEYRRNSMPYYVPFAVILGWLGLTLAASSMADNFAAGLAEWQQKFILFSFLIINEIIIIAFILAAAKKYFEGGVGGFGLRVQGIFRDMTTAAAYFFAVWPLVMAAVFLVILAGRFIQGPNFQMEQNESLAVILEYKQWSLRLLMIFFATIVTPVFEELIFRGLLQSYFRDIGIGPWRAVFIASAVFATLHPSMHFPAIFILAVCMGYAYERSGSLGRSIFVHIFFNASMIAFAILT